MSSKKEKDRILKNVSFNINNKNDLKILEWLEDQDSFSPYVKMLIKKDMEENGLSKVVDAINNLSKVLEGNIITKNTMDISKEDENHIDDNNTVKVDEEQSNIIRNFMNMGGK
ncbi:hypothetical protein JJB63_15270 [Clostridium perfringens]|uniref:hypothetical protein n=1 Tax=Clostridium perfringens TaxID=1502 RepID=UPI001A2D9046|nr:hypothetical protein [Clostridium perfringens]MBO3326930.1 hypothetical protein [Clostridium perfringens]HAT4356355.1 hypothetical protein [Clostridium perfringens]